MRNITSHKVNGLNEALTITVLDEPGQGGANHIYAILWDQPDTGDPSGHTMLRESIDIQFQNGPIKEVGVNGISGEALLAIVEDRLKSFQAGPFSCRENALALTHIQEAIHWLHHRTNERLQRGVEGTNNK